MHLQGLQFEEEALDSFTEAKLADLAGNALLGRKFLGMVLLKHLCFQNCEAVHHTQFSLSLAQIFIDRGGCHYFGGCS